jgi:hypothetical protein
VSRVSISATLNEFASQVDPDDVAAIPVGKKPRRSADPGADIEHPLASGQAAELGKPDRCRTLPAMELVDRGEVVRGQMVDILAGRLQCGEDSVAQILCSVMRFDRIIRHLHPQSV